MKHPIQRHITECTDFNGKVWNKNQIDIYNRYTDAINESAGVDIKPRSLTDKEREFHLNQRHQYFVTILDLNK